MFYLKRFVGIFTVVIAVGASSAQAQNVPSSSPGPAAVCNCTSHQCVGESPQSNVISGVLQRRTGLDAEGRAEAYTALVLDRPICVMITPVEGSRQTPRTAEALHLLPVQNATITASLQSSLQQHVHLTGTLESSQTAHHHERLLMTITAMQTEAGGSGTPTPGQPSTLRGNWRVRSTRAFGINPGPVANWRRGRIALQPGATSSVLGSACTGSATQEAVPADQVDRRLELTPQQKTQLGIAPNAALTLHTLNCGSWGPIMVEVSPRRTLMLLDSVWYLLSPTR
jgi:hypothetical protein